jgi:putative transposase
MAEKRAMIEPDHPKISILRQCKLLGLSRASYYRTPLSETEENLELMRIIDEEYTRHPFLGSRGMRKYLRRIGRRINRKRVQRLMRLMGLASIAPQKRTSIPAPGHKIYPYLLRGLDIDRPNKVW